MSTTFSVINRQEVGLVLTLLSLVVRFAAMYVYRESPYGLLIALSVASALFYLFYNVSIYYFIKSLRYELLEGGDAAQQGAPDVPE